MGIDSTYEPIASKNYWPRLYNEVVIYISGYVAPQAENLRQVVVP